MVTGIGIKVVGQHTAGGTAGGGGYRLGNGVVYGNRGVVDALDRQAERGFVGAAFAVADLVGEGFGGGGVFGQRFVVGVGRAQGVGVAAISLDEQAAVGAFDRGLVRRVGAATTAGCVVIGQRGERGRVGLVASTGRGHGQGVFVGVGVVGQHIAAGGELGRYGRGNTHGDIGDGEALVVVERDTDDTIGCVCAGSREANQAQGR